MRMTLVKKKNIRGRRNERNDKTNEFRSRKRRGKKENQIETAKKMLEENLNLLLISKCTGLSESERDKVIKKSLLGKYFVSR